jgi:hypothetical protein
MTIYLLDNYLIFLFFLIFSYILIGLFLDRNSYTIKEIFIFFIHCIFFFILCYFLYIFYLYFYLFFEIKTIYCCSSSTDPGTVSATVNINVSKEGAEAIASGLQSTGSQIGLGAAIGGLAAAASKSIAGSGLPPIQKVGLIGAAGVLGALAHSGATALNRGLSTSMTSVNSSNNVSATSTASSNTSSPLISSSELEKSVVANSPLDPSIFNFLP